MKEPTLTCKGLLHKIFYTPLESSRYASNDTEKKDTYHYIVASKLKNSHLNGTELAQYCGVSCSTVTKHLTTYRESMRKYISQAS